MREADGEEVVVDRTSPRVASDDVPRASSNLLLEDGGGMVGPNLTDDYWIHGPSFSDNLKGIWNGVPSKGMVTWRGVLKPGTIHAVGSYIHTLRGTKPPNPKPPENQQQPQTPNIFE